MNWHILILLWQFNFVQTFETTYFSVKDYLCVTAVLGAVCMGIVTLSNRTIVKHFATKRSETSGAAISQ
jgi:hypothetical protein